MGFPIPMCGNYRGEPYSTMVKFPSAEDDPYECESWVRTMSNSRESLTKLKEIWICRKHFGPNCDWKVARGGKRPNVPPSIFKGVPKSCFVKDNPSRRLIASLSKVRRENVEARAENDGRIADFNDFLSKMESKVAPRFKFLKSEDALTIYQTDNIGRKALLFVNFLKFESPFGFLHLNRIENNGIPVAKNIFNLLHKSSQVKKIISRLSFYQPAVEEKLEKIISECEEITKLAKNDCFQFIQEQLERILKSANDGRYSKDVLILHRNCFVRLLSHTYCSEILSVILRQEKLVSALMNKSFQNDNLCTLFDSLQPEQRLLNVRFDEVKLKSTMRHSNSHDVGHSSNRINELATHALAVEIVCHFGGPRFVRSIIPESSINAPQLTALIDEAPWVIREKGG